MLDYLRRAGADVGFYRCTQVTTRLTYLEMELLRGGELQDRIRDGGIAKESAVPILLSAARSLAELHEHGIVHRDIKPENLVFAVAGEGEPTIVDYGYAHFVDEECQVRHPVGSMGYVAPEALNGETCGMPNDVFGLGCVLYTMLYGSLPFSINTTRQGFCKAVEAGPTLEACPSPDIEGWLRCMLHPLPSERPTANDIVSGFRNV